MGVDLGSLLPAHEMQMADLAGQTLAVDAYNTLYQFVSIIRQPDGTPLKDLQGRVTSHLSGLFYRGANVVEAGIKPVFVFDGVPHELKSGTLRERALRKEAAQDQYEQALAEGDIERARTKAQQTSRLSKEMVEQSKRLITALGMDYVEAPQEGEAQAAELVRRGKADAAASQDYDALLFGAPRLVRNLTVTGRRKLPRKQVWVDVVPEELRLAEVENETGLSRAQWVDVAMLLGTDFEKGVKGVGPKKAVKLIEDHGDLEGIQAALESGAIDPASALHKQLTGGWHELGDIDVVRSIFLKPTVDAEVTVHEGRFDPDAVVAILVEEHGFADGRVRSTVDRYTAVRDARKQASLDSFF